MRDRSESPSPRLGRARVGLTLKKHFLPDCQYQGSNKVFKIIFYYKQRTHPEAFSQLGETFEIVVQNLFRFSVRLRCPDINEGLVPDDRIKPVTDKSREELAFN